MNSVKTVHTKHLQGPLTGGEAKATAPSATREYVRGLDDTQARLALVQQFHRVRLLAITVAGLLLFMGLLLVNVRNPQNPVDSFIWNLFVTERENWANRPIEIFTSGFNTLPDCAYAVVAIVLIGWWRKSWWPLLTIGLTMLLSSGAMVLVKNILDRQRPPLVDRLINETTFSFPSGHSTGIAALCVSVFLACYAVLNHRARWIVGILLTVLMFTVACSRLYVGVHWGSDVLAGLTLGTTTACLVYAIFPHGLQPVR
ncbi:MAG: phosphatase PAP2 family protein [Rothia sp. (in: high G+C Gram-positive bacteria)]|nr:phosphatase PAP2 family protein [Rothia sp. (in: high G+C Gram-positive bacteria)]